MYREAISDSLWDLLKRLNSVPGITSYYLGGGTALALHLGHRQSDDLDFFVPGEFDLVALKKNFQADGIDILIVNHTPKQTELLIQSVKVDFIREQIPLKLPLRQIHPEIENIKIADPIDIGRMKLISIGSRGSKKDFVDLFCLTRQTLSLESLIMMAMEENSSIRYSKLLFLKGLVDFEDADHEVDLRMTRDISWEEVKKTLADEVKKIAIKIK